MTTYVVFRRVESESATFPTYERLTEVDAHDAKSAIAAAVAKLPEATQREAHGATFAATTARSWTEASPEVQLELKVRVR